MGGGAGLFAILKESASDFMSDECPRIAAALAYYTIFSLPPLLILLVLLAGSIWDPATVEEALRTQFAGMIGDDAADQIRTMIQSANQPGGGVISTILGLGALAFGATGAFIQLQSALNRAWEVEPDPSQGGLRNFVVKRMFSFGMLLGIAFLVAVSLALSAMLAAFGGMLGGALGGASELVLQALNFAVSFLVLAALFAAIFRFLPDARIAWRDVWVGALATSLFFVIGKFAIGVYLGRSDPGQAFGAAGSLAVLLVWIYYAAIVVLFGAEFTQTWAERRGSGIEPEEGAVRVVETTRQVDEG
jgi:membrane protein